MTARRYPSRISKGGAPSKRPRAISYIANCPPELRRAITAEDVAKFSGLNITAARRVLAEMQDRYAAAEQMLAEARRKRNSEFVVPSAVESVAPHQAGGTAIHEKALDVGRSERRESR